MKIRAVRQDLTCPQCGKEDRKHLFKVAGQNEPKCADCLARHAAATSAGKSVTLDGMTHAPDQMGNELAMTDSSDNVEVMTPDYTYERAPEQYQA